MEYYVRCRYCHRLLNPKGVASHYAAHERKDAQKLQKRLSMLNAVYKVGDKLQWRLTKFDKHETLTLREPFFIRNGVLLFYSYQRKSVLSADEEFLKITFSKQTKQENNETDKATV